MVDVLANWGWQGCAVALASTAILRASRHMSATTRYHLWWVTLAAVLVLPVVSFQLPAASSQLPASSFPLPAPSFGLPAASSQVPAPSLKQDALTAQSGDSGLKVLAGSWKPEAGSLFVLPTPPVWASSLLVTDLVHLGRGLCRADARGAPDAAACQTRRAPISRRARDQARDLAITSCRRPSRGARCVG